MDYGKGIAPKSQMISLPLHPHCRCKYKPYYRRLKCSEVKDPERQTIESFDAKSQRRILGGCSAWKRWKEGETAESIWNAHCPKYPIRKAVEAMGYNGAMELYLLLQEIKQRKRHTKSRVVVGRLDDAVVCFLEERDVAVHTREIYLTHKGLSHLARDSKKRRKAGLNEDDILKIPKILKNPSAVFFDSDKDKLDLLYCDKNDSCNKMIKLVVDTKIDYKSEKLTLVKTAGYIKWHNVFKNKKYIQIK